MPTEPRAGRPDQGYDQRILQMMEEHTAAEGALLARYKEIADREETDPGVRFLIELILEDEKRHHALFEKMANAIRSFLWDVPVEPRIPPAARRTDPEIHDATAELLRAEKADRKELKSLRSTLRGHPASAFDALIVELMLHDTEKHIAILEHVRGLSG